MIKFYLFVLIMSATQAIGQTDSEPTTSIDSKNSPKLLQLDQLSSNSEGEENLFSEEKTHKIKFLISLNYLSVSSPTGGALSGPGGSFQFVYALSEKWGGGMEIRQSFDTAGNTLLSSFSGRMTYALTGSLHKKEKKLNLRDLGVGKIEEVDRGGFRVQFLISQYYFNGSINTVPYAGMGLSAFYDFPTIKNHGFHIGLTIEQLGNSGVSISPISLYGGYSIWY